MECLLAVDFAQTSGIGVQTVPAVCFSVRRQCQSRTRTPPHLSHSVLFLLPCLSLRWNARSELFNLRVVDVHSGKESWATTSVGGDDTAWDSHVACFVNERSGGRVMWIFSGTLNIFCLDCVIYLWLKTVMHISNMSNWFIHSVWNETQTCTVEIQGLVKVNSLDYPVDILLWQTQWLSVFKWASQQQKAVVMHF